MMDVGVRLLKAIRAHKIDVPILHYEESGKGGIRLYLYGGRMVEWEPEEESLREAGGEKKAPNEGRTGSKKLATRRIKK